MAEARQVDSLDDIDWSRTCFPLGVKLPAGDQPWMGLSKDELLELRYVLEKCDQTPGLVGLAKWVESAIQWFENPASKVVGTPVIR